MPDRVIDAHQHFWNVASGDYDWPTSDLVSIYRTFTPKDLAPEIALADVDAAIVVQTVNRLSDTDSMLSAAEANPWIIGVVGWVPIERPADLDAALDERASSRLRGIRHLIHHEADPDWLIRPMVLEGLRRLAERRLTFDVVAVFPGHLRHVPTVADRIPELTLVLDHLGKPPIRADGWQQWTVELADAAARPNVVAKVSGLDSAAGPGWTVDELRPTVDLALDLFGPDRLMFGSDWPVCRLVSDYGDVVEAARTLVEELSPAERTAVVGGTAARIYSV